MKVYHFWEQIPGGAMPGYLELCIQTWRKNIPGAELVRASHDNIAELTDGVVTADRIRAFSLPMQSDVAAFGIMASRPGIFLDVDTIVLPGFDPAGYPREKTTIYTDQVPAMPEPQTSFLAVPPAARAGLADVLCRVLARADRQTTGWRRLKWQLRRLVRGKPARLPWSYFSADVLGPIADSDIVDVAIDFRDAVAAGYMMARTVAAGDPAAGGYLDVWFDREITVDRILSLARDRVVGLQNSWMPASYKALTADQVLVDPGLLSRLLRRLLAGDGPTPAPRDRGGCAILGGVDG